jgi:hypothetical protein
MTRSLRLAIAIALCTGLVASLPAAAPGSISKSTRMKLHDKAIAAAKALKERQPTNLRAVRTTWGKVKKAFGNGPGLPSSLPVYVIAMNGRFHDHSGVHRRYNVVVTVKRLRGVVGYLDVAYPTQLGSATKI